ncbi:MAG: class I SAM-dependent methyltransferase [Planctomycetota bacterium]
MDIDPACLDATRKVLSRHYDGDNWQCKDVSVFDLTRAEYGTFDIVYSWGVLHHTGDMYNAISKALDMVSPGGLCVLALYRRTRLCGFWRLEKKFYSRSSESGQYLVRRLYVALYRLRCLARGASMERDIRDYYEKRGMSFYHDIHDWLGGYPYESTTPQELQRHVDAFGGFRLLQCFECKSSRMGIFGTGCDQFVFQRTSCP